MGERLRWKIAGWLNKRPGQCWSDLVMWALDGRQAGDPLLPSRPVSSACRTDLARNGECWCGNLASAEVLAERAAGVDTP